MSVAISIRLPEFTAKRLDELAKTSHLSKTDLIIQGLEVILASQLDRKINYLNDPTAKDVSNRLSKTMQTSYPWESNNE